MSNKSLGNAFEKDLCEILATNGFWAHNMAQSATGQPADIIAVKDNLAVIIDCKVCSNDRFTLSRVEENQEMAMTLWQEQGNTECYFALKDSDGEIYMVHFNHIKKLRKANCTNIYVKSLFVTLDEWLKQFRYRNAYNNR